MARIAWSLVHGIADLVIGRRITPQEVMGFVRGATDALVKGLGGKAGTMRLRDLGWKRSKVIVATVRNFFKEAL